jgi:erythromycin esterase
LGGQGGAGRTLTPVVNILQRGMMRPAGTRRTSFSLAFFFISAVAGRCLAQPEQDTTGRAAFIQWATPRVRTLSAPDSTLVQLTLHARIVAFGESVHDMHELLEWRRDVTAQLLARRPVAAVVMETGLVEGRAIDAWLRGETDTAPEFSRALSYDWWRDTETIGMLRWLHAYNRGVDVAHRVHFYGMDMPADGGGSLRPALEPVWRFLRDVDPSFADRSRAALEPIARALDSDGPAILPLYASLGRRRDTLQTELHTLVDRMQSHAAVYRARSSPDAYDWALRLTLLALQTETALRVGWDIPANPRDQAMASNAEWVLAREGTRGVIVIWAHNLHVSRGPIGGPLFPTRPPAVASMGQYLQHDLGSAYVPIGTAFRLRSDEASLPSDPSSVDGTFRSLRSSHYSTYQLDIIGAPDQGPVARWLSTPHAMRAEDGYVVTVPGSAFDAIAFFDTIHLAHVR